MSSGGGLVSVATATAANHRSDVGLAAETGTEVAA